MKRLAQFLVILILAGAGLLPSAVAKKQGRLPLSPKVMQAKSALIVCECPRGMAVAEGRALQELQLWGRFQIVHRRDLAIGHATADQVREVDPHLIAGLEGLLHLVLLLARKVCDLGHSPQPSPFNQF